MTRSRVDHQLRRLLTDTFGHPRLRPGQRQVIDRMLAGQATLAMMPTGAGKSLCYQLPALMLEGRTVVVSPLIALMKDQCDRLRALGVDAVQLNSALTVDEVNDAEAAVADGSARIVFTTPERLCDAAFVEQLANHPTSMLVVDEAHCISQWGHDFRPAFLEIASVLPRLGRPTVLALTATATESVASDIAQQLGIPRDGILSTGTYRPNLHYAVELVTREDEKLARLAALVASESGSGIVYTATVKAAAAVHALLLEAGESVGLYHGRQGAAARREAQDAFMAGRLRVMVATNAFGLGIDKADLRFVIHHQMPAGADAYYQESGRAGRDGEAARCTLLYQHGDKAVQQFFLANRYPGADEVLALYRELQKAPPGDATHWTLDALCERLDRPRNKLQVALGLLRGERVARQDRRGRLTLSRHSLDARGLQALGDAYRERRAEDSAMLERMVSYAQSGACRWKLLLGHLQSMPAGFERCGHCDNCARLDAVARTRTADEVDASATPDQTITTGAPMFSIGQTVKVRRYGRGVVAAADTLSVTVAFSDGDQRSFVPQFVAPARPSRTRGQTAAG